MLLGAGMPELILVSIIRLIIPALIIWYFIKQHQKVKRLEDEHVILVEQLGSLQREIEELRRSRGSF